MSIRNSYMEMGIVLHSMIAETGVNPMLIYCQTTGAPIGTLTPDEWSLLWASLDPNMDREEIISELYGRTIMCMRPSPAWNYMRIGTLNRLRKHDPISVCAYLLGRYFEPHDPAYSRLKRSYESRIDDGISRIFLYSILRESEIDPTVLRDFVLRLALLDSHFDLSICDYIPGFPRNPRELDVSKLADYIPTLASYYDLLVAKKLKLEKEAKLHQSWLRDGGNKLTSSMAALALLEVKPKSEATQKKEKQDQAADLIAEALKAMMDSPEAQTATTQTKPMPKLGGFKMKIAQV